MQHHLRPIPYFPQIMSPELVHAIIFEGLDPARDPRWPEFGCPDADYYTRWWAHVCGLACLKMLLAFYGIHKSIYALLQETLPYGCYIEHEDGSIKGLIYRPCVTYLAETYGIRAEVKEYWPANELAACLADNPTYICIPSVHPSIRFSPELPPKKGGHLVLAHAANGNEIIFHNPSGTTPQNQQNVRISIADFSNFYAERAILVTSAPQKI